VACWPVGGCDDWEPEYGALLEFPISLRDLDDIKLDNPTIDRWFNADAGFERNPARVPAAFQKRTFPFRIDGVRGPTKMVNISFTIHDLPGRDFAVPRGHVNALDRNTLQAELNPTSTQFGTVTAASGSVMRFVTFITKLNF
jgi:hypothetical protein